MLGSANLVAFAGCADLDRSRAFYEERLGLPLVRADAIACVFDCGGTALRVTLVDTVVAAPYTVLGWSVADIVLAVRSLAQRGVGFARYPALEQDDLGIWHAPSGALVAWFHDPDGNTLSLTQFSELVSGP
jgi:catechol 2,3-dioxygenase-like lactoylglutathione lyase family enzyme